VGGFLSVSYSITARQNTSCLTNPWDNSNTIILNMFLQNTSHCLLWQLLPLTLHNIIEQCQKVLNFPWVCLVFSKYGGWGGGENVSNVMHFPIQMTCTRGSCVVCRQNFHSQQGSNGNQKPTAIIVLTFDTWNSGDIYLVLPLDKYHNT